MSMIRGELDIVRPVQPGTFNEGKLESDYQYNHAKNLVEKRIPGVTQPISIPLKSFDQLFRETKKSK